MFYLFILESIGTSELILIGLVALIVFGPRKLPELARMLGKARNEFKRTTDDFKQTWEREVDFEGIEKQSETELSALRVESSIQRNAISTENEITAPEIKEISQADFPENLLPNKVSTTEATENILSDKRDWL